MSRGKASTPEAVEINEKQRMALELRKAGATFDQIAQRLGYANAGGAYKIVQAGLRATIQQPADEVRQLEVERLDAMFRVLYQKVLAGEKDAPRAAEVAMQVMRRRADLLGLDAPIRIEERVITEDAIDAEIRRLEDQLADNDPSSTDGVGISGSA